MKAVPVLDSIYARVDILDLINNEFTCVGSLYFLGEGSKHVKTANDINLKNKQLLAAIGAEAIKQIGTKASISGGDEWDELDELDFEELLNTEEIPIVESKNNAKLSSMKGDSFHDLVLYSKDKAHDIFEKIALTSGIAPWKQYIWAQSISRSITGDEVSIMSYWSSAVRTIEGYPIDGRRTANVHAEATMGAVAVNKVVIVQCVNLDSIIGNKSKLQLIARTDSESFELIHANAIQRFFPLMSLPVFNQYLIDEELIPTKFEDYIFDKSAVLGRYKKLDKLIPALNAQRQITIDSSDLLTITTTGMVLAKNYGDQLKRVDTLSLFQKINITTRPNVAAIDLYMYDDERRAVRLRKLQHRDQYRASNDQSLVLAGLQTRRGLILSRSMVITLLPRKEYETITLVVDSSCGIWIRTKPSQTFTFSKAAFLEFITPIIDPIIKEINSIEIAYTSHERFTLLGDPAGFTYNVLSSSSKITFMFPVAYSKLVDVCVDKLLSTGLIVPLTLDWNKKQRATTSFMINYGVAQAATLLVRPSIDIKDVNGVAVMSLSNLDVDETALYIDIIGRIVLQNRKVLEMSANDQTQLSTVDPLLFRPKLSADAYSRICQKKFQPVVADAKDKKAVEYYNFTFNRPEYYKCPNNHAPELGFIQGRHEQGYCLPCCRKTPQTNIKEVKKTCIANEAVQETKTSTYKIEYPIPEITNTKIMDRRISLPSYVTQLLGLQDVVANGSVLASHNTVRDGILPETKSYLQTAVIIAALEDHTEKPMYKSHREFVLDLIATIKQPINQVKIMKNKIISERFATPQALINTIEDQYIKMTILDTQEQLSAVEWNDIIIFLANCMGMNVLLLSDSRLPTKGIEIDNLNDIDTSRPTFVLLKRINLEWSMQYHNTRALYLPITKNAFKVYHKSALVFERLDTVRALTKLKRIVSGSVLKVFNKQFNVERIREMVSAFKQYKLLDEISEQKIAVIGVGKSQLISTIFTAATTVEPQLIDSKPTASMNDLMSFITDYNQYYLDETENLKKTLATYKMYLQAAVKMNSKYEFIDCKSFLLKLQRFIVHDSNVIGAVVGIVDVSKVVSTELLFIKPISMDAAEKAIKKLHQELLGYESRMNIPSIISFPIDLDMFNGKIFKEWIVNPLKAFIKNGAKCMDEDLLVKYNKGIYTNEIYRMVVIEVVKTWSAERNSDLESELLNLVKKGTPPYPQTTIDTIINTIADKLQNYDILLLRVMIMDVFEKINSIDKNLSDVQTRIRAYPGLNGFDLRNVYKMPPKGISKKLDDIINERCIAVSEYPKFDTNVSVAEQRRLFYKNGKLMIHNDLMKDIKAMLLSDLTNPFRRDYVLHMQLSESSFSDIRPHIGELIYVQHIKE